MINAEAAKYHFNEGTRKILGADVLCHTQKIAEAYAQVEEAIKSYNKAIELDQNQAIFLSAKGFALKKLGATADAIACFEKSIEIDQNFTESHYQIGLCLLEHNLIQYASDAFQDALTLSDNKDILESRLCTDLLELIQRFTFYAEDMTRMSQTNSSKEIQKNTTEITKFALTLFPNNAKFKEILQKLMSHNF